MKKNMLYLILIAFFIGAVSFVIIKFKKEDTARENTQYGLLQRNGSLAQMPEWEVNKLNATKLLNAINANPKDLKSQISLANLFIMEARTTGNYTYYDKAAMKNIDNVLKIDAQNFEALTLKSLLYLSQHHFADGLAMATK